MEIVILQAVVVGVLMGGIYGLFSVGLSLILGWLASCILCTAIS